MAEFGGICIYGTETWRIKFHSLWPSDAILRQRSGSTPAQEVACCHFLNQC